MKKHPYTDYFETTQYFTEKYTGTSRVTVYLLFLLVMVLLVLLMFRVRFSITGSGIPAETDLAEIVIPSDAGESRSTGTERYPHQREGIIKMNWSPGLEGIVNPLNNSEITLFQDDKLEIKIKSCIIGMEYRMQEGIRYPVLLLAKEVRDGKISLFTFPANDIEYRISINDITVNILNFPGLFHKLKQGDFKISF